MAKTLREACEATLARGHVDWPDDVDRDFLEAMGLDRRGKVHPDDDIRMPSTILAALDAERAAVLEEVLEWIAYRADAAHGATISHDDRDCHAGVIRESREAAEDFRRHFLAGKEGA